MFGIDDILLGIASKYLIPLIGDTVSGWFSDNADKAVAKTVTTSVATAALQTAAKLTGVTITDEPSAQAAVAALQADPAKLADYQRALNERAAAAQAEETKRLQIVNETIRAEIASEDPVVRRMRPMFGYAMALTWTVQMLSASYTIVLNPARAAEVLNGIAATTMLWGMGLAVLGVYVNGRTQEKGAQGIGLPTLPGMGKRR
jgi:hypothetical protein